ncbi:MAG: hypothetical protein Q8K26_04860 [Candidatus Gracilibacteria bacterium]|nr:hypothetical protein [Candidatus Gracilibacteria bacterium]
MNSRTNINLWVKQEIFPYLESGEKTVEGRLGKPIYFRQKPGSIILINKTEFRLERVMKYPTFRAMLEGEGIHRVLPMIRTINEGETLFYRFFSKEDEIRFGVVALQVQRILSGFNNLEINNQ